MNLIIKDQISVPEKHIKIKLILAVFIFQFSYFLLQQLFDYFTRVIFWGNNLIGPNRWNGWVFDYSSSGEFLNSFWGVISSDFFSLFFAIYLSLYFLREENKFKGWKVLLIYRLTVKMVFLVMVLIFVPNQNILSVLGYWFLYFFFDLVPFFAYGINEQIH